MAHRARTWQHFGFQTGDLVRADKLRGKDAGRWTGRVTARTDGHKIEVRYDQCQILQHQNGWHYT